MRVLVTVSSGKLGNGTVKLLADFGYRVTRLIYILASPTLNLIAEVKNKVQIVGGYPRLRCSDTYCSYTTDIWT